MDQLGMELRAVDVEERTVLGVVAPYDEVSYLVPDPAGERVLRGAFKKSIAQRAQKIPLCRNHDHSAAMGRSRRFEDGPDGLVATFKVNAGAQGDAFLEDLHNGYYQGLSAGFQVLTATRGQDGVRQIADAKLVEVSAVAIPAYQGAGILAVRNAQNMDDLLAPFRNRPDVNLAPVAPIVHTLRN
jgi:HK97 family phage prohead protease